MDIWVRILLAGFASFRLAELLVYDDGPFDVFKKIRVAIGRRATGNIFMLNLALLLDCPFCTGVWSSALVATPVLLPSIYGDIALVWLGISGFQASLAYLHYRQKQGSTIMPSPKN